MSQFLSGDQVNLNLVRIALAVGFLSCAGCKEDASDDPSPAEPPVTESADEAPKKPEAKTKLPDPDY